MPPLIRIDRAAEELLCCLGLGYFISLLRLFFPWRGRLSATTDFLWVGISLFALQSYAAGFSHAGCLRWYMTAALCTGSAGAVGLLRPTVEQAQRFAAAIGCCLFGRIQTQGRAAVQPVWVKMQKERKEYRQRIRKKKEVKKQQNPLQKTGQLLYNSNV